MAQSESPASLAKTPLYDLIKAQNARMTDFAGWEMPVQFTGLNQEHTQVRQQAGIFDISHMGKFALRGRDLLAHLQMLVPSDLSRLQPGRAQYTVLLNSHAGIIDDLIIYYQGEDESGEQHGMAIANAATRARDKAWLLAHFESEPVVLTDLSKERVLLAVQGPTAQAKLQPLVSADLDTVPNFGHLTANVLGQPAFLARTGYTGEDGFEIMLAPAAGQALWSVLCEAGVAPCGLGARDTLRLEAAMALYGQDLDDRTTPLEAGLRWLVHMETKGEFLGRPVLERQRQAGVERRLVGLEMQGRHIARHGYPVLADGQSVGVVTSGTLSPTLGKAIALAYVPTPLAKVGTELMVEIRDRPYPARVVKKPFYHSPHRR
ncbi:MAG: glycine cleavage system aminomethyltransferase GcvT [Spirulinaceae cyanobacterium SM2_1_0]|nr:glycine cleavage system aminomethyltransferase GcvT [Spirulinaceae cyanobacterium SM2_1_0]